MNINHSTFADLREHQTPIRDPNLTTEELIQTLASWDAELGIKLFNVTPVQVGVTFEKLPEDLDAFAEEVYKLCPDVVDELFVSYPAFADDMPNPNYARSIEGLDELDDDFGLNVMKRWLKLERSLIMGWT